MLQVPALANARREARGKMREESVKEEGKVRASTTFGSRERERASRTINHEPALQVVKRDQLVARDVVIVAVIV